MSELINTRGGQQEYRLRLLVTVSALTLLASASINARAEDNDRPILWLELGGQLERIEGDTEKFAPAFLTSTPRPDFETFPPLSVEDAPRYAKGYEGKITFNPEDSNWTVSASVRFGRSNGHQHKHAESNPPTCRPIEQHGIVTCEPGSAGAALRALDAAGRNSEFHEMLDFQAGKDFGIGVLGSAGRSALSFGVRYAQMHLSSSANFDEVPDQYFPNPFHLKYDHRANHRYVLSASAERSFHGIGPSISWDSSASLAGSSNDGEIIVDWGLNGAALFGRQKTRIHHRTTSSYYRFELKYVLDPPLTHVVRTVIDRNPDRTRSVIVPNVGGFAGLSFRYSEARLSLGYRADMFFGAMDGGIDTRKSENRGFYGPFATISVGIGG